MRRKLETVLKELRAAIRQNESDAEQYGDEGAKHCAAGQRWVERRLVKILKSH